MTCCRCVFEVKKGHGLVLTEIAEGVTVDQVGQGAAGCLLNVVGQGAAGCLLNVVWHVCDAVQIQLGL